MLARAHDEIAALATNSDIIYSWSLAVLCCLALLFQRAACGPAIDITGQRAAESAIWREQYIPDITHRTLGQQHRLAADILFRGSGEARDESAQLLGVGASLLHSFLRPAHLAACHHLHSFGDLRHIFDRADTPPDFAG